MDFKKISEIDPIIIDDVINIINNMNNNKNMIWNKKNVSLFNKSGTWLSICLRGFLGSEQSFLRNHKLEPNLYKWTRHIKHFPSVKELLHSFNTELYLVRLLKLSAKHNISPHADITFNDVSKKIRLHIPIITNDNVHFKFLPISPKNNIDVYNVKICNNLWKKHYNIIETVHLKTGFIWYTNVNKIHSVINNGDNDRIHLVIDLKPTPELLAKITSC